MDSRILGGLTNQRNIFVICTSPRKNIVVAAVPIKTFVHYHYGPLARNISTCNWKIGMWKSKSWNFTVVWQKEGRKRFSFKNASPSWWEKGWIEAPQKKS